MPFALLSSYPSHYFEQFALFHIAFIILFVVVNISFGYDVVYRLIQVSHGQPADRWHDIGKRMKSFVQNVIFQKKLFRHPLRGLLHVFIFYGFLYYGLHTTTQMIAGAFMLNNPDPYLFHILPMGEGEIGAYYNIGLDFISLLVLIGLGGFAARRWVLKARELDRPSGQSALIIGLIGTLMISTILGNAALTHIHGGEYAHAVGPVAAVFSGMFSESSAPGAHAFFWWIHILTVFVFMIVVPRSKHSHLIFAPLNFWFTKTEPKGAIRYMDLEDENAETWGAGKVNELPWTALLDGLSCIECGRCTLSCPANITGKKLNPKKIMTDIKHATIEKMPAIMAKTDEAVNNESYGRIIDDYTTYDELWACTSCYACVDQCPVGNDQLESIIDMRRYMVLSESNFPAELQTAFQNMENNYNPWGVGAHQRAEWTEGMDVPIMAEVDKPEELDYLFWVGCAGSYDDRNKKISRSLANIMNKAGIKYAILGQEETCSGDSARRGGNEYLYQTLAMGNVETMNNYNVKNVVTACPHCFNTIKNEYPQFGGNFNVIHHSQMIDQLLDEGKINVKEASIKKATFHDSCYLGRYNDEYEAPRNAIKAATGKRVTDVERNRNNGMCCGAGGAQMWMEETEGTRVNVERTNQLLEANPEVIGTSCPFCITMVTDGVKAADKLDKVAVLDIAEIVEKQLD